MNRCQAVAFACALSCLSGLALAGEAETARAAQWLDAHRENTPMLRQFLQLMPKGADLHSHLSGAVYAETYLKLAANASWCVDTVKLQFAKPPCGGSTVPAQSLPTATYSAMVDHLSMRNVEFAGKSGHDQFFATFGLFGPVGGLPESFSAMQAEVRDRAASQNIQYLELMTTVQGSSVRALGRELAWGGGSEPDLARRL